MTRRRGPVQRPPVPRYFCRGCNVDVTSETAEYRVGPTEMASGFFCTICEIDDPVGIGRERPFDQKAAQAPSSAPQATKQPARVSEAMTGAAGAVT